MTSLGYEIHYTEDGRPKEARGLRGGVRGWLYSDYDSGCGRVRSIAVSTRVRGWGPAGKEVRRRAWSRLNLTRRAVGNENNSSARASCGVGGD